jgi:heterodisulfide reductase subunit D
MVTGKEANNARSRAALLSLVIRGFEYTPDLADAVYECALCGACTAQCATNYDPLPFTRAARLEAVMGDIAPREVKEAVSRILEKSSAYEAGEGAEALAGGIAPFTKKAPVLLYLGASRLLSPRNALNAVTLLKKTGLPFMVMEKEPDCGSDLADLMGPAEEAREFAAETREAINKTGAEKLICLSPDSAKVFLREYREWGIPLDANVETFTSAAASWIRGGLLKPVKKTLRAACQDPYQLGRDLGETAPLREIISACADLREMYRRGKEAIGCGEGAIGLYRPDLSRKMAERRMADAVSTDAELVVTACPQSFYWLEKAGGLPVKAVETLLTESLGKD